MDLTKVAALVLSAKKAVFYPDSGAPLSGRYCWRDLECVLYLHYEGIKDELLAFRQWTPEDFSLPPFSALMQKHLVSCKKLPEFLLQRCRLLQHNFSLNLEALKGKDQIISLSRMEFLVFREQFGFVRFYYDSGWRLSFMIDEAETRLLKKLWKEPFLHTRIISPEMDCQLSEQINALQKCLNLLREGNYGLFLGEEVYLCVEGYFYKINRAIWEHSSKNHFLEKISGEQICKEYLLEKLVYVLYKKKFPLNSSEGLLKIPKTFPKNLS